MAFIDETQRDHVVRISFGWLILGVVGAVLLGVLGGVASRYFGPVRSTPLIPEQGQLVSTVQEVTLSPNTAVAELVGTAQRSVVALATGEGPSQTVIATGALLTNDGVIATSSALPRTSTLVALDFRGVSLPLDYLGSDNVYGIGWWRVRDGVFTPFELVDDDPSVGTELIGLARSAITLQPRVDRYSLSSYRLPHDGDPVGWQRVAVGSLAFPDDVLRGAPLLDDNGHLAAVVMQPSTGTALPASQLMASLTRLTQNNRELNPFENLGLDIRYTFTVVPPSPERRFVAEVLSVVPGTPAAAARLQRGDFITAVDETAVSWQELFVAQLAHSLPLTLTVVRGDTTSFVELQPLSTPTPQ